MRVELNDGAISAAGRDGHVSVAIEIAGDAQPVRCGGYQAELNASALALFFLALRAAIVDAGLDDHLRQALAAHREREIAMRADQAEAEG